MIAGGWRMRGLPPLSEFVGCQAYVFSDLPQQDRRNVAARMDRHSGASAVRMPELLM